MHFREGLVMSRLSTVYPNPLSCLSHIRDSKSGSPGQHCYHHLGYETFNGTLESIFMTKRIYGNLFSFTTISRYPVQPLQLRSLAHYLVVNGQLA